MLKKNIDLILKQISPSDKVLDIGGWMQPFNRTNYVIDIMPYETRGFFGYLGPEKEFFSKETWLFHDVSSSKPLPFKDKEIDFVICSHVLEDVRDPLHLCSEITRIGKRGYIEVPSRTIESIIGLEGNSYAGYSHHRWFVEIKGSEVIFRSKPHLIYASSRFYLPRRYLKKLKEEDKISYLFWEDSFQYKEIIQIASQKTAKELEEFARSKIPPTPFCLILEKLRKKIRLIKNRIQNKSDTSQEQERFWENIPDIESR